MAPIKISAQSVAALVSAKLSALPEATTNIVGKDLWSHGTTAVLCLRRPG